MSFLQNLEWRYATKKFNGETLPQEKVDAILNAVRMAPTSYGLQPFHVTVITDPALKAAIMPHAFNQAQIESCSHLLVFSARTDVDARIDQYAQLRTGGDAAKMEAMAGLVGMMKNFATMLPDDTTRAAWAARQAYIALGFAMAAAAELEVDSCPMEGFMPAGVKEVLGLPDHVHPVVLLPIGTRASDDTPYPKARFPQDDLFTNR